jgi:D-arabinose 1-dehydrogenase-like Zn-dependent alcohol dehydrogenase
MNALISFVVAAGIQPEVSATIPMAEASEAIGTMIAGHTRGKTVFTR